ncbi:hypothetical protein DUNSADRAFT_17856 [Dunaliella salina]|uniref:Nuclear envelope membrane protein n=1 Tax=Dunaliella salina TaxID=3046 RepID=A0ABQ7G101_DUNSA|nr:hypothetical protein DUNSADRAFT_17856 [Dunaliella salina]|eukprot:KAF5828282.1 hypothetical protein DUNSADRAFT_17856 [Dunaliella salina]
MAAMLRDAVRIAFGATVYCYFLWLVTYLFAWSTNAQAYIAQAVQERTQQPVVLQALDLMFLIFPRMIDGSCGASVCASTWPSPADFLCNTLLFLAWTVPHRSVFVLQTCTLFHLLINKWVPMPLPVYDVSSVSWASTALHMAAIIGFILMIFASFLVDHFDLFGLRHVFMGEQYTPPGISNSSVYKFVRHPIYLGTLITFVSTPTMTLGRLLFAALSLCYMLVGIQLEEQTIAHEAGPSYAIYRRNVPALIPRLCPFSPSSQASATVTLESSSAVGKKGL